MTYLTSVAGGVADGGSNTHDSPALTISGSNKVVWALVGNSDGTPATPTGVVLDPTGVNQAFTIQGSGLTYGTFGNASLWRLIAPSDVTAKIVRATWAANKGERIVCVWVENDIDQTTPNGTVASANSTGANQTPVSAGAVTTAAGQRVLQFAHSICTSVFSTGTPFNTPTGTERQDTVTTGTAYDAIAAQEETASGSSTTPSWASVSDNEEGWATFAFAVNVASGGGGSAALDDSGVFPGFEAQSNPLVISVW